MTAASIIFRPLWEQNGQWTRAPWHPMLLTWRDALDRAYAVRRLAAMTTRQRRRALRRLRRAGYGWIADEFRVTQRFEPAPPLPPDGKQPRPRVVV